MLPFLSVTLVFFAYGVKIQDFLFDQDEEHARFDFLDNEDMLIITCINESAAIFFFSFLFYWH